MLELQRTFLIYDQNKPPRPDLLISCHRTEVTCCHPRCFLQPGSEG